MPDLRGLSAREAVRALSQIGMTARMSGDGVVVTQNPEPGESLAQGGVCSLRLNRRPPQATRRRATMTLRELLERTPIRSAPGEGQSPDAALQVPVTEWRTIPTGHSWVRLRRRSAVSIQMERNSRPRRSPRERLPLSARASPYACGGSLVSRVQRSRRACRARGRLL